MKNKTQKIQIIKKKKEKKKEVSKYEKRKKIKYWNLNTNNF